jgi:hypothetical protein
MSDITPILTLSDRYPGIPSVTISDSMPGTNNETEDSLENKNDNINNTNRNFLHEIKSMGDTIEEENSAALNNFYYIYSAIQELQGNLNIKISEQNGTMAGCPKCQFTSAECQITLPNLKLCMEGTGNSPLDSLVDLTEKLRPIVDKFAEDKKSINPCSIM